MKVGGDRRWPDQKLEIQAFFGHGCGFVPARFGLKPGGEGRRNAATFGGGGDLRGWPVVVAAPATVRRREEESRGREREEERDPKKKR